MGTDANLATLLDYAKQLEDRVNALLEMNEAAFEQIMVLESQLLGQSAR